MSIRAESFIQLKRVIAHRPEDMMMSVWLKRIMAALCFAAFFYAYYIEAYDGMAMLMILAGIWSLDSIITKNRILFFLDIGCVTLSFCIIDTLFLSGELQFLGPFMSLLPALASFYLLGLVWGNILGIFNCAFVTVVLSIDSFDWIRTVYSQSFCEHFPYIMIACYASALFVEYSIAKADLAKLEYQEVLAKRIAAGKEERSNISLNILVAMYKALCTKSPEVGKHCENTAEWANRLARDMGYTPEKIRNMYYAGLLHDIGKIGGVGSNYWYKNGMQKKNREQYLKHIETGYQIVSKLGFEEISAATYYHHEKMNGRGYLKVKGEDIPIAARVVSVANMLAHLESETNSYEEMISILYKDRGDKYDPNIIKHAIKVINGLIKIREEETIFGKIE